MMPQTELKHGFFISRRGKLHKVKADVEKQPWRVSVGEHDAHLQYGG